MTEKKIEKTLQEAFEEIRKISPWIINQEKKAEAEKRSSKRKPATEKAIQK